MDTENNFATEDELSKLENESREFVEKQQKLAWDRFQMPIVEERAELSSILEAHSSNEKVSGLLKSFK